MANTRATAASAFSPPDSRLIDPTRLPGGFGHDRHSSVQHTSSPVSSKWAWPPPNSRGNSSLKPALTRSKVSWKRARVSRSILRMAFSR